MTFKRPHTISIKRGNQTTTYVNGHPVDNSLTTYTGIKASVQPLSGKDKLMLPEGDRTRQIKKIYTVDEVLVNDIIIYDSEEYEVQTVQMWQGNASSVNHYKSIAYRIEGQ